MLQKEFEFNLPKGYLDENGNLHSIGLMRLAKTMDEIEPLSDPRVQSNPGYATVIILSRVITKLGQYFSRNSNTHTRPRRFLNSRKFHK